MKKSLFISLWIIVLAAVLAPLACASSTDISQVPLDAASQATPNIIFGLDDSGSTDWEILLSTSSGAAWWSVDDASFTTNKGVPLSNSSGVAGPSGGDTWFLYGYLFPNGSGLDARHSTDQGYEVLAVPPIPAFAWMRSSDYNPLYYNPEVTYTPWQPAYINGSVVTFPEADPTAARSHPLYPLSGTPTTLDLAATQSSTASNWTFRMAPGMTIPGAEVSGILGRKEGSSTWQSITTDYTIPASDGYWDVDIPYYPATYYVKDPTCKKNTPGCYPAPDGAYVRQYVIAPGNTFPSGRSYSAELQNFANWFTYYRKRAFMLVGGIGQVLSQVTGIRAGAVMFNHLAPVTMYDLGSSSPSDDVDALLGYLYQDQAQGATPTRETLNYIGQQYMTNDNVIQYGCQRNSAFILTDGYANGPSVTVPSYDQNTWEGSAPYQTIYSGSLADIASAYYTLNLRSDLPAGLLSINPADTSPNADKNTNLHMNTYGVVLDSEGDIYGTGSPAAVDPFLNYPDWPTPVANEPSMLDDLWHATINGRGLMFTVNDLSDLQNYMTQVIQNVLTTAGSDAGISVSDVNAKAGNDTAYVSSYDAQNWTGELAAYPIDTSTGDVSLASSNRIWSASGQLSVRNPDSRIIVTYNGATGVPFETSTLPTSMLNELDTPGQTDAANVLAYLRGDRSLEGNPYRVRDSLLGDIVDAKPVYVGGAVGTYTDNGYSTFAQSIASRTPVVYQGANDGMLHAFNATTGAELWAYIPSFVFPHLNALSNKLYTHQFYVDAAPTVGDVDFSNTNSGGFSSTPNWQTILVGGLRAGGDGYYALNITNPTPATETAAAANVLWEFPNASTSEAADVGLSYGKPVIVKTQDEGWVVLVTSGYNNGTTTGGDGEGHLFVLDPVTGAIIKDLSTGVGTPSDPSGLADIAAFVANPQNPVTDYVYGGDLDGNVWRFDLTGPVGSWKVYKLATLVDASGNPQPVTTTPQLTTVDGQRLVVVGTGRLLGASDIEDTKTQSVYGLVDNMSNSPTISPLRSSLMQKTVTVSSGGVINITSDAVDYTVSRGWYFDLPNVGERLVQNPQLAFGALVFTTDQPSDTACGAASYLYNVDVTNGGAFPAGNFVNDTPYAGKPLGNTLASQPLIITLPHGRLDAITHKSDTSIVPTQVPVATAGKTRRVAWKEIFE